MHCIINDLWEVLKKCIKIEQIKGQKNDSALRRQKIYSLDDCIKAFESENKLERLRFWHEA